MADISQKNDPLSISLCFSVLTGISMRSLLQEVSHDTD